MSSARLSLEESSSGGTEGAFAALAALLERQTAAARALHRALKAKQRVLAKSRLDQLQASAETALGLASELACLESQRIAELERLAAEGHLPADTPARELKAERLLELVPPRDREALSPGCHSLATEIGELAETNLQNDMLLHNLIEYTNTVMRLITRQDSAPTYGPQGSVQGGGPGRALLDSRV